jgi:hypothetical protein
VVEMELRGPGAQVRTSDKHHWKDHELKYLLLVGIVTVYFWHMNYAEKCSEESAICWFSNISSEISMMKLNYKQQI